MQNTNTDKPASTRRIKPLGVGLVMLVFGVLVGMAAMKYAVHGAAFSDKSNINKTAPDISTSSGANALSRSNEWNPFKEMRNLEAEMDRVFQRSFEQLRLNPQLKAFKEEPGYSLKLDVRDLKDRFEVRASLPDAKASDVKVNLENNQTLKVVVNQSETEKGKAKSEPTVTEWGRYEQVIDLPAPVKAGEMKVDRKDHELVITLPKST